MHRDSITGIVLMVLAGGTITSVILLLVVIGAMQFRFKRLPRELKPKPLYDIALMVSVIAILALAVLAVNDANGSQQQRVGGQFADLRPRRDVGPQLFVRRLGLGRILAQAVEPAAHQQAL